jgi:hypothetical protein
MWFSSKQDRRHGGADRDDPAGACASLDGGFLGSSIGKGGDKCGSGCGSETDFAKVHGGISLIKKYQHPACTLGGH